MSEESSHRNKSESADAIAPKRGITSAIKQLCIYTIVLLGIVAIAEY
ncbi:MAG: hypothetical protein ACR2OA_15005 [Rubripirellula sp.]|jgi:hypothetical protein